MIIHAADLGYMHCELTPSEASALCLLLGVDDIDLKLVFVTFLREDLTSEASHTNYSGDTRSRESAQRELDLDDLPF